MLIFLVLPRLSCLDVMQGSVRRKQQTPEGDSVITPGSPHTRDQSRNTIKERLEKCFKLINSSLQHCLRTSDKIDPEKNRSLNHI